MKKITQGLSLLALSVSVAATGQTYNAKHMGKGFTSINDDFTASISNPALINKHNKNDDIYFSFGLGLQAADEDEVLDKGEDVSDAIDALENAINDAQSLTDPNDITAEKANLTVKKDALIDTLEAIDEKPVKLGLGGNVLIAIPNQYLNVGLFAQAYGKLGAAVNYASQDNTLLSDAVDDLDSTVFDDDVNGNSKFKSGAQSYGYLVTEVGVILGKTLYETESYTIDFGTKIKNQSIDIVYLNESIQGFDEDDFDFDEESKNDSAINFDLAVTATWGNNRQWNASLVANNLSSQELTYTTDNDDDVNFELKSHVSAGVAYSNDWVSVSAEVDLTDREGIEVVFNDGTSLESTKSKYAAIGVELNAWDHAQLRFGTRTDLNDIEGDIITAGIGLSPFDLISLDIAGFAGDEDAYGASIQFGFKL